MSQLPPDAPQPPQLLHYALPTNTPRPTSVLVLGIIGIVFGAIGVLCTPFQLFGLFAQGMATTATTTATTFPVGGAAQSFMTAGPSTALVIWSLISTVIGVLLAIALLAGGIGSVMLKAWARKLMVGYSVAAIVVGLISLVVTIVIVLPETTRQLSASGMSSYAGRFAVGGALLGTLLGMIYPVCVFIFFRKPHVVEAFESQRGLGAGT